MPWFLPVPSGPQSCSNYGGEERGKDSTLCFLFFKFSAQGVHISHVSSDTAHFLLNDFSHLDIDCLAFTESGSCPQISFYINSPDSVHAFIARLYSLSCYDSYSGKFSAHASWRPNKSSNAETLDLEMESISNFSTNMFACGGVFLYGYVSLIVAYFVLRRKAQNVSADRPILEVPWWKSFCASLSKGLFIIALLWTITLAVIFSQMPNLTNRTCPLLITPGECRLAAPSWQILCVGTGLVAALAFTVLIFTTYTEATRPVPSAPERSYHFCLLASSHCFSAASWLFCVPLLYPAKLSALVGPLDSTSISAVFAFLAVTAYMVGTALWIVVAVRVFCGR